MLQLTGGVVVVSRMQQCSWTTEERGARSPVEVLAEEPLSG